MIISVNSGAGDWSNYVINGTKTKQRDSTKVIVIDGDLELGDKICKSNHYKDKYYSFVLGFKGRVSDDILTRAYQDFKETFLIGFDDYEYHIDAVIHQDTDNSHIHLRVPKQNLLTNTQLQLYHHKKDVYRKELIQDYISLKYGFPIAREGNGKVFKEKVDYIDKWKKQHSQEIDFSSRQSRKIIEESINGYLAELHQSEFIYSLVDIKKIVEDLDLKVVKFGHDLKKDFSYMTIENGTGKLRVKGELYNEEFFRHSTEHRNEQIKNNRVNKSKLSRDRKQFNITKQRLKQANKKRIKEVTTKYSYSREKAKQKFQAIYDIYNDSIVDNNDLRSIPSIQPRDKNEMANTRQDENRNRQNSLYKNIRREINVFRDKFKFLCSNKGVDDDSTGESIIRRVRDTREDNRESLSRVEKERGGVYNSVIGCQSSYLSKIKRIGTKIEQVFREKLKQTKISSFVNSCINRIR